MWQLAWHTPALLLCCMLAAVMQNTEASCLAGIPQLLSSTLLQRPAALADTCNGVDRRLTKQLAADGCICRCI